VKYPKTYRISLDVANCKSAKSLLLEYTTSGMTIAADSHVPPRRSILISNGAHRVPRTV